jgi:hypothetical protein
MIRHVVAMKLKAEYGKVEADELVRRLGELADSVPSVRSCIVLQDAGLEAMSGDVLFTAEFDDESKFRTYVDHPAHRAVVDECVGPWIGDRLALQIEF